MLGVITCNELAFHPEEGVATPLVSGGSRGGALGARSLGALLIFGKIHFFK